MNSSSSKVDDYYLHLVLLEDCPYSNSAADLINNYNIKNVEINRISRVDIDKFKTDLIKTYPQVYLKRRSKKGSMLLGGYDNLKNFFDKFYKTQLDDSNVDNFMKKSNWSKKSTLRLIELINQKV